MTSVHSLPGMPAIRALFLVIQSNPGIGFAEARKRACLGINDAFDALVELSEQYRIRWIGNGWIA